MKGTEPREGHKRIPRIKLCRLRQTSAQPGLRETISVALEQGPLSGWGHFPGGAISREGQLLLQLQPQLQQLLFPRDCPSPGNALARERPLFEGGRNGLTEPREWAENWHNLHGVKRGMRLWHSRGWEPVKFEPVLIKLMSELLMSNSHLIRNPHSDPHLQGAMKSSAAGQPDTGPITSDRIEIFLDFKLGPGSMYDHQSQMRIEVRGSALQFIK